MEDGRSHNYGKRLRRAGALGLALLLLLGLALPAAATEPTDDPEPALATIEPGAEYATDRVVVQLRENGKAPGLAQAHGLSVAAALGAGNAPTVLATAGRPVPAVLAELRKDPNVVYAEPDYVIHLAGETTAVNVNDAMTASQYSLDRMRVRDAWSLSTGSDRKIAVLDTGVQYSHPDLSGRLLAGYDFVNGDADASDDNGHGTWVSGILAARVNDAYGVAGISWSDKVLPVKVMNANGTGYTSHLIAGLRWAADQGASVINMSIGGYEASSAVEDAVNYAWSKGAVLVGAAGNNGRLESHYPASFTRVISVTATQMDDEFTKWSNYGPLVDVAAPGGSVLTTNCDRGRTPSCAYYGNHIEISGTSFASPNAAGVVALIRARYPTWTPQQVMDRLLGTADDLGYAGWDNRYGWGRVNAYRALGGSIAQPKVAPGDSLEGNNALSSARGLTLGVTFSPTIYPAGDVDYFQGTAPRAGRLDFRVTAVVDTSGRPAKSQLPIDPVLELLTPAGARLALIDHPTDSSVTEVGSVNVAAGQTVVARVVNWAPNGNTVPYTVTISFADTVGPTVIGRYPASGAVDVNRAVSPTVTFDEPVKNVTASTLTLTDTSTNALVPASVSYDAAARRGQLVLSGPLAAQRTYRVNVSSGVTDLAGNAVAAHSWTFTTGLAASYAESATAFEPPTGLRVLAGTHVGYKFDDSGRVIGTKPFTLSRASSAAADLRETLIASQGGTWLRVTNGIWAGYWLRESTAAYLPGEVAREDFSPSRTAAFAAGTHTGYRFDAGGNVTAVRRYSLSRSSSAPTSARAVINGRPHMLITAGVWSGYWVPESSYANVRGEVERLELSPPHSVGFAAGAYVGYTYDANGGVTATRWYTLPRSSSAPGGARAVINGRTHVLITAGVWAGHWVPLVPGVSLR